MSSHSRMTHEHSGRQSVKQAVKSFLDNRPLFFIGHLFLSNRCTGSLQYSTTCPTNVGLSNNPSQLWNSKTAIILTNLPFKSMTDHGLKQLIWIAAFLLLSGSPCCSAWVSYACTSIGVTSIDSKTRLFSATPSSNDQPIGLYIHIPYCRRRCRYCNFSILPIGPNAGTDIASEDKSTQGFLEMDQTYLKAVLCELQHISISRPNNNSTRIPLQSIYFGGGTPSLAPTKTIQKMLYEICGHDNAPFILEENSEVSMEMDPGTFSLEKLQSLQQLGIQRISMGVQSLNDTLLESMGRMHRTKDIYEAIDMLDQVYGGDVNYSIDLMSGLPGLSLAHWMETLTKATLLTPPPSHLSLYDLQVEQGTVFGRLYDQEATSKPKPATRVSSAAPLPSEDDCAFMYKYASGYLRSKGWEHYEVSSYSKINNTPDRSYRSRHNQLYWHPQGQWYSLGLGSTSFVDGRSLTRPKTLVEYVKWVDEQPAPESIDKDDDHDYLTTVVMKRLRTLEGLDLGWVQEKFGESVVQSILKGASLALDLGLAKTIEESGGGKTLQLMDPDGLVYSNYIISSIFMELDGGSDYDDK